MLLKSEPMARRIESQSFICRLQSLIASVRSSANRHVHCRTQPVCPTELTTLFELEVGNNCAQALDAIIEIGGCGFKTALRACHGTWKQSLLGNRDNDD